MPWKETNVLDQRKLFISRWLQEEDSFTELCEEFGIPRKTGYKWRARYIERGLEGLVDMSRRPKTVEAVVGRTQNPRLSKRERSV